MEAKGLNANLPVHSITAKRSTGAAEKYNGGLGRIGVGEASRDALSILFV